MIEQIKVNPKAFYSYTRRKLVIRTKVVPLLVDGVTVGDEKNMTDVLSIKYESVCSIPRVDISSPTYMGEFLRKEVAFETEERLETLPFDEEETKKVINKLSNGAAVGPDGIPTL